MRGEFRKELVGDLYVLLAIVSPPVGSASAVHGATLRYMGYSKTINHAWSLMPDHYRGRPRGEQVDWVSSHLTRIHHWNALEEHLEWESRALELNEVEARG